MTNAAPIILALETSTSACSVALTVELDGEAQIIARSEVGNNIHSQLLLSMVEQVLFEARVETAQLDAIAVGQGPGSFTGLRIGVGVAQGLAYGAACPMVGVSSLEALAVQAPIDGAVLAGIDARMGEVYWCEYRKQSSQLMATSNILVTSPEDIGSTSEQVFLLGNAWVEYREKLSAKLLAKALILDDIIYPNASSVLQLAMQKVLVKKTRSAIDFAPIYVRNDVAKKSTKNPF